MWVCDCVFGSGCVSVCLRAQNVEQKDVTQVFLGKHMNQTARTYINLILPCNVLVLKCLNILTEHYFEYLYTATQSNIIYLSEGNCDRGHALTENKTYSPVIRVLPCKSTEEYVYSVTYLNFNDINNWCHLDYSHSRRRDPLKMKYLKRNREQQIYFFQISSDLP